MMEESLQQNTSPEAVPWNIRDVGKAALVAIAVTIALGIVLSIVLVAMVGTENLQDTVSHGFLSTAPLQEMLDILETKGLLNIGLIVIYIGEFTFLAALALTAWLFGARKYHGKWESLGFRKFDVKKGLLLALIVTAVGIGISTGYEALLEKLGWITSSDISPNIYSVLTPNNVGIALFAIVAVVVAPLAEEIFFRSFLFQGVRKRLKFAWAAIISAAIFAVVHMSPTGLVPIFILGLMLAWLFNKTRSVWPCIIVHCAYNSIALIFMIIS